MTATAYRHIAVDPKGVPWIVGHQTKVVELVAEHIAYRWDAEQLHSQHPHLTLGEIYSALAYYYDHQQAIDADIKLRQLSAQAIYCTYQYRTT